MKSINLESSDEKKRKFWNDMDPHLRAVLCEQAGMRAASQLAVTDMFLAAQIGCFMRDRYIPAGWKVQS